jgi:hypothetical protein
MLVANHLLNSVWVQLLHAHTLAGVGQVRSLYLHRKLHPYGLLDCTQHSVPTLNFALNFDLILHFRLNFEQLIPRAIDLRVILLFLQRAPLSIVG